MKNTKYTTRLSDDCKCTDCREAAKRSTFQARVIVVCIAAIAVLVATSRLWL